MKSVLFITGAALGHIGRSLLVARALESRMAATIHFACLAGGQHYENLVSEAGFAVTLLPGFTLRDQGATITEALETLIAEFDPSLIYCDINPLPQLLLVRFPVVPRVFLVNAYETRLGTDTTVQDLMWREYGEQWNRLREQRGLPPVDDPRSFFDADLVLLPDPEAVVGVPAERLPPGYRLTGPCIWDPPASLPPEIEEARDLLLLSMGSTGINNLPLEAVRDIGRQAGASRIIRIGSFDPGYGSEVRQYDWLPGSRVVERCRLVLTQGGAGSTYQALRAGVPVVCTPAHHNHVALARRLQQAGAGMLLFHETWQEQLQDTPIDILALERGARLLSSQMQVDGAANAADAMAGLLA